MRAEAKHSDPHQKTDDTSIGFVQDTRAQPVDKDNNLQYLYRAFSSDNQLLYVGISSQWHHRLHQHEKTAEWIERADYVKIERFADRASVEEAEKRAIKNEKPVFNKVFAIDYESAPIHWIKIKRWIQTGEAPDPAHQFIIESIRESAQDVYEKKPNQLQARGMAFLYLETIEFLVYKKIKPCRNCVGLWNSSIIQPGYEGGEEQLLEGLEQ